MTLVDIQEFFLRTMSAAETKQDKEKMGEFERNKEVGIAAGG